MMHEFLFQIGLINPTAGWAHALIFAALMVAIIVGMSKKTDAMFIDFKDGLHTPDEIYFYQHFLYKYPVWGTIQQFIVFTLLYIGRSYFPDAYWIDILIAMVFGMFHFPNWFLVMPTIGLAMIFIQFMDQYHNLYAVGVVHGMLGTCMGRLSPKAISTSFMTWSNYANYQKKINKHMKNF